MLSFRQTCQCAAQPVQDGGFASYHHRIVGIECRIIEGPACNEAEGREIQSWGGQKGSFCISASWIEGISKRQSLLFGFVGGRSMC